MNLISRITIGLFAATFVASLALAQSQGISKTEIVIGTIQDLSGPIAAFGKQSRNGIQMRVDEVNEKNGINGRKFKLMVEDNGYDPKKALLAAPPGTQMPTRLRGKYRCRNSTRLDPSCRTNRTSSCRIQL